MEGFLSVKEATKSYAQGCKAKAATSIGKLFGKAMLAGMMIGMGAAASSVAAHSVANVGLAKLSFCLNEGDFCRTCKTYCGSCIPSRFDDGNSAGGRAVYW